MKDSYIITCESGSRKLFFIEKFTFLTIDPILKVELVNPILKQFISTQNYERAYIFKDYELAKKVEKALNEHHVSQVWKITPIKSRFEV